MSIAVKIAKEQLESLRGEVTGAQDLLNRLKLAGENTSQAQITLSGAKEKLNRYLTAFDLPTID